MPYVPFADEREGGSPDRPDRPDKPDGPGNAGRNEVADPASDVRLDFRLNNDGFRLLDDAFYRDAPRESDLGVSLHDEIGDGERSFGWSDLDQGPARGQCTYSVTGQRLVCTNSQGQVVVDDRNVYSGNGIWGNMPEWENVEDLGSLPRGDYAIGPAYNHPGLGPMTSNLSPQGHDAYGRTHFRIHGDNSRRDGSASHGCLIAGPRTRETISRYGIRNLHVFD